MERNKLIVVQYVNSSVGKFGNVGFRSGKVIEALNSLGIANYHISRGFEDEFQSNAITKGRYWLISRSMTFLKSYVFKSFRSRLYDDLIFRFLHLNFSFKKVLKISDKYKKKILLMWSYDPKIISKYKKHGFQIVLDIQIAPAKFSEELFKNGFLNFLPKIDSYIELEKEALKHADKILSPSIFVTEILQELYLVNKERISTINFGVEQLKSGRKKLFQDKNKIRFCFLGNLTERKGIRFLIEAWKAASIENAELHICGRYTRELKSLLNKKDLKSVYFPGFVNSFDYLQESDIYVFPSLFEGSSKSVFEAMACGLPIITTPNSGSIVTHNKEGIIVPIGEIDKLAKAMIKLASNLDLRLQMGEQSMRTSKEYTWKKYGEKVTDALLED